MATDNPSASRIFISYRRSDSELAASRLADDLRRHFTREQVFQDFASIDPGNDFVEAVERGLDSCAAVLVVIGPNWLDALDHRGRRRLDLADDWVRHEVAQSLRRPGVRVFPVLVESAKMPAAEDLPDELQPLTRRQAFPVTNRHWPKDVAELIEHLQRKPGAGGESASTSGGVSEVQKPSGAWKLLAAIGVVLVIVLGVFFGQGDRSELPLPYTAPPPEVQIPVKKAKVPAVTTPVLPAPPAKATTPANKPREFFHDCEQCPEMVVLPAGSFMMGSPMAEARRSVNEGPPHKVTIARPFAVGQNEVTFAEWDACVAAGACQPRPGDEGWGRGRRPVIHVNWDDAQAYASWLAKKTGKGYRLLSEAEWEYAARAKTETAYPWGDERGSNHANFASSHSQWSGDKTAPVGSFDANDFGLYDMIGNVYEWVQDCWNGNYAGAPVDGSAWLNGDCGRRVIRGGSWYSEAGHARAAYRSGVDLGQGVPTRLSSKLGFRLAKTL
ncbi:MAG: SUMF1/EgtB/PvdO family nonheme iron enzyme [Candidatus Accumulibacter sp.]|uniref:SUMF1/EgtB/PvdO family nonheme iron enzyme n=1 Tax=Candidatus Accumulibacter affinis TaxID=2954384 RepID=A0A935TAI9_9PROT|nr:SUMF1/EgtB/PvdO family nonheme iron enzyme [Candidatus Accumulibacter affinis]